MIVKYENTWLGRVVWWPLPNSSRYLLKKVYHGECNGDLETRKPYTLTEISLKGPVCRWMCRSLYKNTFCIFFLRGLGWTSSGKGCCLGLASVGVKVLWYPCTSVFFLCYCLLYDSYLSLSFTFLRLFPLSYFSHYHHLLCVFSVFTFPRMVTQWRNENLDFGLNVL